MTGDFGNLDALIDAIADRVVGRLKGPTLGPTGEPVPGLPGLPGQRDDVPSLFHPKLHVQGLELTQSIQYYGTGYGAENSVPIVALKPLVVRAYPYVTAGVLQGDALSGKTVTGELVLFRGNKEVYRTSPTRVAGARVGPESRLDRDLWDQETTLYVNSGKLGIQLTTVEWNPTLNFVVPAYYVRAGHTTAFVRLWLTSGEGGVARVSEHFHVISVNAPKIALVRVNWKNSATNTVTSPTNAELLGLSALATRMLPFPYFATTILGVEQTKSEDFSAVPAMKGGCNTAWTNLLTDLKVTRIFTVLFKLADIVYGVVPQVGAVTKSKDSNTGCGWEKDGVGGCLVGDEVAFAHEIGHLYGCGHIGDPTLVAYDANYPNYGGSKVSIGEVGIDTALGTAPLSDPRLVRDLMSYKRPRWVSPYTYQMILDNRENHMSATADPNRVRPLLIAAFKARRVVEGAMKIDKVKAHVVHAPGSVPASTDAARSIWALELVDRRGTVLASHACRASAALGGGCGCSGGTSDVERAPELDFVEAVEWSEETARVQIRRGDAVIATFDVGEAPSVQIEGPENREGKLKLHVRAQHPRGTTSLVVLFTGDDGETWSPVAIDPPQDSPLTIDASSLPGGESCRFRAVATAELRAASADSRTFSLPRADRRLLIELKQDGCKQGRVDLTAMIDLRGHEGLEPHEIVWHSDLTGELGRGYSLSVDLEEGRHRITATIPGGAKDRVQEAGIIVVGGRDR